MNGELTALHWVFMPFIVLILAVMVLRRRSGRNYDCGYFPDLDG